MAGELHEKTTRLRDHSAPNSADSRKSANVSPASCLVKAKDFLRHEHGNYEDSTSESNALRGIGNALRDQGRGGLQTHASPHAWNPERSFSGCRIEDSLAADVQLGTCN